MGLLVKDHVLHPTHCRSSASVVFFCCLRSSGVIRKKHCCSNRRLPFEQQCFNCLFLLHWLFIERWELFYSCFVFLKFMYDFWQLVSQVLAILTLKG
ncbi:hypothetical protein EY688_16450 [Enterococcus casseliflavus]|nr:hypothetical protein [Enterococcus casseliflavus]MBO6368665.1 hypothetical protein [Enterococcus casseliflavus]